MTVPYNYEGRARRRCPTCEVEIDVVRPSREYSIPPPYCHVPRRPISMKLAVLVPLPASFTPANRLVDPFGRRRMLKSV